MREGGFEALVCLVAPALASQALRSQSRRLGSWPAAHTHHAGAQQMAWPSKTLLRCVRCCASPAACAQVADRQADGGHRPHAGRAERAPGRAGGVAAGRRRGRGARRQQHAALLDHRAAGGPGGDVVCVSLGGGLLRFSTIVLQVGQGDGGDGVGHVMCGGGACGATRSVALRSLSKPRTPRPSTALLRRPGSPCRFALCLVLNTPQADSLRNLRVRLVQLQAEMERLGVSKVRRTAARGRVHARPRSNPLPNAAMPPPPGCAKSAACAPGPLAAHRRARWAHRSLSCAPAAARWGSPAAR